MARLTAPNGSIVNVSDERAETLLMQGYSAAGKPAAKAPAENPAETAPAPAKKAASRPARKPTK